MCVVNIDMVIFEFLKLVREVDLDGKNVYWYIFLIKCVVFIVLIFNDIFCFILKELFYSIRFIGNEIGFINCINMINEFI